MPQIHRARGRGGCCPSRGGLIEDLFFVRNALVDRGGEGVRLNVPIDIRSIKKAERAVRPCVGIFRAINHRRKLRGVPRPEFVQEIALPIQEEACGMRGEMKGCEKTVA